MYELATKVLVPGSVLHYHIHVAESQLSFAEVLTLWQEDKDFCLFFNQQLADIPYRAYFWETPPVNWETRHRPFEWVAIDSPTLANESADKTAFWDYFTSAPATTFPNLGRDALLVVPSPISDDQAYTHLANFVRQAPPDQRHSLWSSVGQAVSQRLESNPLWLSTSGLGVSWLHVRLDSRPKYYQYGPYRDEAM